MTLFTVVAYVYVVLPWASSEIAMRIPTSVEQTLGEHTQTFLSQSGFEPSALPAERQQALQQLFRQVMPAEMREERTPLSLKLMAVPGAPNAFMLPDGTLVLSDSWSPRRKTTTPRRQSCCMRWGTTLIATRCACWCVRHWWR